MRKLILVVMAVCLAATAAIAGNVQKDGNGSLMQVFAPIKSTSVTQTKADKTYTPTSGTKMVMIQPSAAVTVKVNGTGTGYPLAANANFGPIGIATRLGVGTTVSSLVFSGASSATKTIYILEQ